MAYGLERGATSNFKYIIDTGVQSTYVLQNRTDGYETYHFSNIIALFFGKLIKI